MLPSRGQGWQCCPTRNWSVGDEEDAMTTFTAWKFGTPEGAQAACDQLDRARAERLVKVIDRAVLEWPDGADKPTLRHTRDDEKKSTGWGAFWGLVVGSMFFVPVIGAAAGAGVGALYQHLQGVGLTEEQLDSIKEQTTPGSSVLFAVTDEGDLDRLGERFRGFEGHLVSTNLTGPERALLLETFD
jgi:uncharacterized membrane protein